MYRIYINEASLIITQKISQNLKTYQEIQEDKFHFLTLYRQIVLGKKSGIYVILTDDAQRLFKRIKKEFTVIKAAGGAVVNEENQYLFIFRKGKWDLPKGKLDAGEKTKRAAVREVEEECGITVNSVSKKLAKTWHVYEQSGQIILKKTTWYCMYAENQPNLIPQLEEDITEARWVDKADFKEIKKNTYPLILELIKLL